MAKFQRSAWHGVLFLDKLPEFNRRSLEVLRQPLEQGQVTIARALASTTEPQLRYSKEDHARRGAALYDEHVRLPVEAGNKGKVVALDVDSGAFEEAEDTLTAAQRLLARHPGAQIRCVRIGHPAVHRLGPRVVCAL